jgi:hypothetical protein
MIQIRVTENGKEVRGTNYGVYTNDRHTPLAGNKFRLHNVHPVVAVGFIPPQLVPVNKGTRVSFRSIVEGEEGVNARDP